MKVLWIVNHTMPELANHLGVEPPLSGSWLVEISKEISKKNDVELHILSPSNCDMQVYIDGITYHTMKISKFDKFIRPSKDMVRRSSELIEKLKPEIIHLQGSEFPFSLAFLEIKAIPTIISIQGLISEINKPKNFWADIKKQRSFQYLTFNNILIYLPIYVRYLRNKYRAKSEIRHFELSKFRIGRTIWDEAHTYYYNKDSKYFYLQETIRHPFRKKTWDINKINKYTIFCASGYGSPLKGAHKVFECIAALKSEFPNIVLRIPGENLFECGNKTGYNRYLYKIIKKLELENNIIFLGKLNSEQMADEFSKNHVSVIGSSIENSSNTLGEALCVGIPTVVPYVGGLPSLASDNIEVLFYHFGDVQHMSWQIRRIFSKDEIAVKLSKNSIKKSIIQYPKGEISTKMLNIYCNVIGDIDDSENIKSDF